MQLRVTWPRWVMKSVKILRFKGSIYIKFSKNILIFLFVSSILGAFSYALYRTDGNVYKSILFTLYFFAIKIGLIGPNVPLKFDQHQPNQQLVSTVVYNPYVSFWMSIILSPTQPIKSLHCLYFVLSVKINILLNIPHPCI